MALTEYGLQLYNRPIDHFADLLRRDERDEYRYLDLNASYQRGSVWTLDQKRNLIRSVLEGIPIGAVYLNYRPEARHTAIVVDGKQRIEALIGFERDEFSIPADWLTDDMLGGMAGEADEILFSQTTRKFQNTWGMTRTVAVYESRLPGEAAEKDLFDRINFGGCPQGEQRWRVTKDDPEGVFTAGQVITTAQRDAYNVPVEPA
jgi:hypothetical protein